jgi:sec-independent protein translocase protein TatA
MPGGPELIVILLVVALLFGGTKLPKLARSLGSAKGEFEKGLKDGEKQSKEAPAANATPAVDAVDALAPTKVSDAHIAAAEADAAAAEAEAKAARAKAEAARLAAEAKAAEA